MSAPAPAPVPDPRPVDLVLAELPPREKSVYLEFLNAVRHFDEVRPEELSDVAVFRFLKSVDWDAKAALEAVRKSVEWRRGFDWDSVRLIDYGLVSALLEFTKVGFYGEDFEGRPIKIVQPADIDPGDVLKKIPKDKPFHFQLGNIERLVNIVLPHLSRKHGRNVHMQVVVVDIRHVNFGRFLANPRMLDLAKSRSAIFQENYPETTARTIIVNAGPLFYGFFKLVSVFLRKKTLERIRILDENFLPELLTLTTLDRLPRALGGTCPYEIDNFPNSFDAALAASYAEQRLG